MDLHFVLTVSDLHSVKQLSDVIIVLASQLEIRDALWICFPIWRIYVYMNEKHI